MSKDYSSPSSSIVKEYNEKNANQGVKGEILDKYFIPDLGQEFHATGKLRILTNGLDGYKIVWVGIETLEGYFIPIHQLLSPINLNGFYTEGRFISESIKRGKIEKGFEAKVVSDFDFTKVFQPSSRGLLSFIAEADCNQIFKGCIFRFLGTVIRPYEARKNSPASSEEKYYAGMKRVRIKHLWEVRLTPAEQKRQDEAKNSERLKREREEEAERAMRAAAELREREETIRREKANYNERNRHRLDDLLRFDSGSHLYSVNGIPLQSVTDFVEHCFPEFDARTMARHTAARTGQNVADVLEMWERKGKESRDAGTEMHKKIESFYQLKNITDDDTIRLFRIFTNQITLNPYRTEWSIYDTATNLAGTVDFVDYTDGKFIIYDWKRSDKLVNNGMPVMKSKYNKKALPPISHVEDCAYYHYAMQLSLYKYILEKNYGIEISDLRLGVFHPTYNKPYVLKVPYMKREIDTLMSLRESVIL